MKIQKLHDVLVCDFEECDRLAYHHCFFCKKSDYCDHHYLYKLAEYYYDWNNGSKIGICVKCHCNPVYLEEIDRLQKFDNLMKSAETQYNETKQAAFNLHTIEIYNKYRNQQ